MSEIDDLLTNELKRLPAKPAENSSQAEKKRYSELMSAGAAGAVGEALRSKGLKGTLPLLAPGQPAKAIQVALPLEGFEGNDSGNGEEIGSRIAGPEFHDRRIGAERRMDGGLGAKKVDVTWATEESGLLLAVSIKTINFKDRKTGNYQKNLTNRRNDMLFESTTLHRRFPYATLGGFFFLDAGAKADGTPGRHSTFHNAHRRLKMFTGRGDPAGRPEQYERLYIVLVDASPENVTLEVYRAGDPNTEIALDQALVELIELVAERSPDFYEAVDGRLISAR